MGSLKIEFDCSLSYYHESNNKIDSKESHKKKELVMHGGRHVSDVEEELKRYKTKKFSSKQDWMNSQNNLNSMYSKSRLLYKPDPKLKYKTNDVVRLARN